MTIQHADLLTIGAGGGAYPAAFRLARAGRSVVMVDPKGVMSGNCLYEGCVPSKAVRETAEIYQSQRRFAERGLPGTVTVDFAKIMAHKDSIQARRYQQHAAYLAATPNIQMIQGEARLSIPMKWPSIRWTANDDSGVPRLSLPAAPMYSFPRFRGPNSALPATICINLTPPSKPCRSG